MLAFVDDTIRIKGGTILVVAFAIVGFIAVYVPTLRDFVETMRENYRRTWIDLPHEAEGWSESQKETWLAENPMRPIDPNNYIGPLLSAAGIALFGLAAGAFAGLLLSAVIEQLGG